LEETEEYDEIIEVLSIEYLSIKLDDFGPLPKIEIRTWVVDDIDPIFCESFLRFKKPELRRLYGLMRFPMSVKGGRMSGEKIFIRGLYQMATGASVNAIAETFGRHYCRQVRAFKYFINQIFNNFKHLVNDNLNCIGLCESIVSLTIG
jgi:hypothetical protein